MEILYYYLNRADRPDRRAHMEEMLTKHGLAFKRVNADLCDEAKGFKTCAARANWISHTEMIRQSAYETYPVCIMEDDVNILDLNALNFYAEEITKVEDGWDVLYFHGSTEFKQICGIRDMHAYMVNPNSAEDFASRLDTQRTKIENDETDIERSFIDIFVADFIQKEMRFCGTPQLVVQDRNRFGSDTGWGWKNI